ncbi:hypothetical protein P4U43_09550 [Arthrobacter sp. EH-1B-1]|uniref:DUF559 domain-containing protein n=2 Tax=Arthrobacter TaxID=1663 RepID=A0ABT6CVD3_9MICC|nr:hypothetical protein [Arthrobacter vasquezii]MDF9278032.1 hypothetical protein [Arthrobacter vasquezii]
MAHEIPYSRLRAKDLTAPTRGIREAVGQNADVLSRAEAFIQLNPGSCVSHVSAARLHGIAVPGQHEDVLHLARPARGSLTRRNGVVSHRLALRAEDTVIINGLPVTSVFRTFVDLGTLLHLDDLVAAGDSIVSEHHRHFGEPRHPMIPVAGLRKLVEHTSKIHGIRAARLAIDLIEPGVDSPPETQIRLMLGRAGLPVFVPNCRIDTEIGLPVWADLGCHEFKTCIEYDGGHHLTPEQQQYDARRDQRTREADWAQVKLNKLDIRKGEQWITSLARGALRSQGWPG